MTPQTEAAILAASQPLHVPGAGVQRVLTPMAVEQIAAEADVPRWSLEADALDTGIAPLHYLRNLARFGAEGQSVLLRAAVTVVGAGAAIERALELLALNGVGRFNVLVPQSAQPDGGAGLASAEKLTSAASNRNASCQTRSGTLPLRGGNPRAAVEGASAVAACLEDSMDEQLLQFACRVAKTPLVLAGVELSRGQATTVFPGDPGVALVYKPNHPHLEPARSVVGLQAKASLMVGAWLAEQVTAVLLGNGELLRSRLLYADLDTGEMTEYPL